MIDASARRHDHKVTVDAIGDYRERIDVRSPSEFAEDHLPGAASHPVLDDAERVRIGTLHAQDSAFAARRAGAAIVARNIAAMLETSFAAKPRDWAPLVYCWRGGQRSRSLVHMLNEIGWRAAQLDGGYRAYRRQVVARLVELPGRFRYNVVCGLTGSGKSRLHRRARRRGSAGARPRSHGPPPRFAPGRSARPPAADAEIVRQPPPVGARRVRSARPVYVESESRKIGAVQLPDALLAAMRTAECIRVVLPPRAADRAPEGRVRAFPRRSRRVVRAPRAPRSPPWQEDDRALDRCGQGGNWDELVGELLALHYDPMYQRSIGRNFPRSEIAIDVAPSAASPTRPSRRWRASSSCGHRKRIPV